MAKMALGLLSLVTAAPASTPISAGRWEVSIQMKEALFDGRRNDNPTPARKPHVICLATKDAAKGPGLAFSDASLCRVLKSNVKDGAFSFETECKAVESDDVIVTRSHGRYSADSYVGTSTSLQRRKGKEIEMRSRMEAKRVGEC
ncbi:DUF3617 domain-containing protein [Sphingomonas endolithica]|uniref:DUF3617 domain-containing protein n=1 Tax=Sphingomonas endolithica TaxID=2972485 RepID=UPI0021AE5D14|nr:DUF3617 domain-containing protein [Sphingomonas sp. ZFBP2030]